MQHFNQISDFLGNESTRYFPQEFKHFKWEINRFQRHNTYLEGLLSISYSGSERPRSEPVHLGSIEYIAISFSLAEHALIYLLGLSVNQLNHSLPHSSQLKLTREIVLQDNTPIPFQCHLIHTENTRSFNNNLSTLHICIGTAQIKLTIDHPGTAYSSLASNKDWFLNLPTIHNHGYKLRDHQLKNVTCLPEMMCCLAQVIRADHYTKNRHGIGSAYQSVIPSDVLSITGQLMQTLLYTLTHTDRHRCQNIWLRSLEMQFGWPIWQQSFLAEVQFKQLKTQKLKGNSWRTIRLESQIGTIAGCFNIAYPLNHF